MLIGGANGEGCETEACGLSSFAQVAALDANHWACREIYLLGRWKDLVVSKEKNN